MSKPMKPALVLEIARDLAEAIRANPLAVRDVQELLGALSLTHADLVSADVPEADLRELCKVLLKPSVFGKTSLSAGAS